METIFWILIYLIHAIVAFFLCFHAVNYVIFWLKNKGNMVVKTNESIHTSNKNFACIITAYKDAQVALPLIRSLANQQYDNFKIYLIADDCSIVSIPYYENLVVLSPSKPLHSKSKSLKYALENISISHDTVVIFDADNVALPHFLSNMNKTMSLGYNVVQSKRTALNTNTDTALLDGLGEKYYNFNSRYIPFQLGHSATIAGSGMAIDVQLFRLYINALTLVINQKKVITGEDKLLQQFLVQQGHTIAYDPSAILLDEKVESIQKLRRQRTRWFNAYFANCTPAFEFLGTFDIHKLFYFVLLVYPPIFMLIGFSTALLMADILFQFKGGWVLLGALVCFSGHFFISILAENPTGSFFKIFIHLPIFCFNQFAGLLQFKKADNDFMPTSHIVRAP